MNESSLAAMKTYIHPIMHRAGLPFWYHYMLYIFLSAFCVCEFVRGKEFHRHYEPCLFQNRGSEPGQPIHCSPEWQKITEPGPWHKQSKTQKA